LLEGQPAPGLPMLRQLHWIVTAEPASEQTVARVLASTESDTTQPQELWRHTAPYRRPCGYDRIGCGLLLR
jgi:hypothetical protein